MSWLLMLLLACGEPSVQAPTPSEPSGGPAVPRLGAPPGGAPGMPAVDQQQQHPPLPADNPAWEWDAGGFVPDFGWYGEHTWDDVRMRVAGHLSVAGRDLARLHAGRGDLKGCAAAYSDLATRLEALPHDGDSVAGRIGAHLLSAARRDAAVCAALAEGQPPPTVGLEGLALARAELLGLLQRHAQGADVSSAATALQERLEAFLAPRPDLDLDTFRDFDDRHRLRVALFQAYLDQVDPLQVDEPWGYWEPEEIQRTALILGLVAGRLGGADWTGRAEFLGGDAAGAVAALDGDPLRWPSILARALPTAEQAPDFTVEGLGWLPTGDSLIDVAAQPGPRAIGTLEKLGLEDTEHRAWLHQLEASLDEQLAADPGGVPPIIEEAVGHLDAMGHGSRYYNIKQLRNEAVRQLARAGHTRQARAVLGESWPLHHQDWACPNREGILRAIDGRLMLRGGEAGADARLEAALDAGTTFLALVDRAEAGEAVGQRPPAMGGGPGAPPTGRDGPPGPPPGQGPPGPPPGSR